jgi:hypothetical protein
MTTPSGELREAAALLRVRGRIEIPNAMDNDTDPVDSEPLADLLALYVRDAEWVEQGLMTHLPGVDLATAVARSINRGRSQ